MLNLWKHIPALGSGDRKILQGGPSPARPAKVQKLRAQFPDPQSSPADHQDWAHELLDFVGDAVLSTDIDTRITFMNAAAEEMTGFNRQEVIGQPLQNVFRVIDVSTRQTRTDPARQVLDTGRTIELHNSSLLITRDRREIAIEEAAKPLYNADGKLTGALVKFHDARFSAEITARMAYLAQHDALTGLLNRYAFAERFEQAAALATRHEKKMVMLFIDLDNFKVVNDVLGHGTGDALLMTFGRKLLSCVRSTDHVCRHGGDEFVVLISDLKAHEQAFAVADKVHQAARELACLIDHDTAFDVSIGMSIYPDEGRTLKALLNHADADMYAVKARGRKGRKPRPPDS